MSAAARLRKLQFGRMINFTQKQPNNKRHIKAITEWVEDALPESLEEAVVMVNELQCFEPGCAPLETVVSLLGDKSIVFKIFKPCADVTPKDALDALEEALAGKHAAHLVKQQEQQPPQQQEMMISMECDSDP